MFLIAMLVLAMIIISLGVVLAISVVIELMN